MSSESQIEKKKKDDSGESFQVPGPAQDLAIKSPVHDYLEWVKKRNDCMDVTYLAEKWLLAITSTNNNRDRLSSSCKLDVLTIGSALWMCHRSKEHHGHVGCLPRHREIPQCHRSSAFCFQGYWQWLTFTFLQRHLGYKQVRYLEHPSKEFVTISFPFSNFTGRGVLLKAFAASFCTLNFIGGTRCGFRYPCSNLWRMVQVHVLCRALGSFGIYIYRPLSNTSLIYINRSTFLITVIFMLTSAAVVTEICSALPSIYIWAAESAGPKYAKFFWFIVDWWSCTAWMTFPAICCQVCPIIICTISCIIGFYFRFLQIISFLSLQYGQLTSREEPTIATSSGGLSSGLFLKCSF